MEKSTRDFLRKIRIDTYIYTYTFMAIAIGYSLTHTVGTETSILLLATFAFYTIGRQIRLVPDIDAGAKIDTKPKVAPWIRGIVYCVIILLVLSLFFS